MVCVWHSGGGWTVCCLCILYTFCWVDGQATWRSGGVVVHAFAYLQSSDGRRTGRRDEGGECQRTSSLCEIMQECVRGVHTGTPSETCAHMCVRYTCTKHAQCCPDVIPAPKRAGNPHPPVAAVHRTPFNNIASARNVRIVSFEAANRKPNAGRATTVTAVAVTAVAVGAHSRRAHRWAAAAACFRRRQHAL